MNKKVVQVPQRVRDNAEKIAFLVSEYPDHTLTQIFELLEMPAVDMNTAMWYAVDTGLVSEPDEETKKVTYLAGDHNWQLGSNVETLEATLLYAFGKLALKETDLEEVYLSNWTSGYSAQDVLIVLRHLESSNKLAQYQLEDGDNKYVFFTLFENKDKLWGQKQFKQNPLTDEDPLTEENTAEED